LETKFTPGPHPATGNRALPPGLHPLFTFGLGGETGVKKLSDCSGQLSAFKDES
jgi:hypothetical protein